MRILTLLLLLLASPVPAACFQTDDAPDGAVIDTAEVSGIDIDRLSPGLRQDIHALSGTTLDRAALQHVVARIEAELPDVVAAVRSVSRPESKAQVVFLVARVSDDRGLSENINARYVVEDVAVGGAAVELGQELRDDLRTLVGKRLNYSEMRRLTERLRDALPGYDVTRRVARGTRPGTVRVSFEVYKRPWTRFLPSRSKLVYHQDQGWSGALDIPMSGARARRRVTVGFALGNSDDLIEEYSGFRVAAESRVVGTERVGASLEISRYTQSWEGETLEALAAAPSVPRAYGSRLTVEPMLSVAFTPSVRAHAGASVTELGQLAPLSGSVMANAWVLGVSADHEWRRSTSWRQSIDASYQLRTAEGGLGSDLGYTRHVARARYQFQQGHTTVVAASAAGRLSGQAPLFERFTLGDTATLRGWNRYDIAPIGGARMIHQSLELRYASVALFVDAGSVWEPGDTAQARYSTGVGLHGDNGFITLAFPLNSRGAGAIFMMGVKF